MSLVQPSSHTFDLNAATDGKLAAILDANHPGHAGAMEDVGLTEKNVEWKGRAYTILKYDKARLTDDARATSGLFRSVVVHNGKIVSFSPPKALTKKSYEDCPNAWDNTLMEEFVEGTMMNLFCVEGEWEMATRSLIGANGRFFNDGGCETFRKMFLDAAKACGPDQTSENGGVFALLNPAYSYSFVFQHPDNQIVTKVSRPSLYLVRVYECEADGRVTEYYTGSLQSNDVCRPACTSMVDRPAPIEKGSHTEFGEVQRAWASMERPHAEMGLVVYSPLTGGRCTYRNPTYEMVRHLRGNQPKLQYQYLELRTQGKVGEYLQHFPAAAQDFARYREQLHLFTKTLHDNYVGCFVKKDKQLREYSPQFKPHMWALHEKYRTELREKKHYVSLSVCVDYVNCLPASKLMFALNWHVRENNRPHAPTST